MYITGLETVSTSEVGSLEPEEDILGKDDFLTLLVTQLENQDPLNPMDSTEFTAQLAQYSSLEQLYNVNDNLENLQTTQSLLNNSQAVSFIGKTVKADGNSVQVTDGDSSEIYFELGADASAAYINIYDAAGSFVKSIESGALSAGEQSLAWDGNDSNGNVVSDGEYTFEVMAVDLNGEMVDTVSFSTDQITGITYTDGSACLLAGDKKIPIESVIEITE